MQRIGLEFADRPLPMLRSAESSFRKCCIAGLTPKPLLIFLLISLSSGRPKQPSSFNIFVTSRSLTAIFLSVEEVTSRLISLSTYYQDFHYVLKKTGRM